MGVCARGLHTSQSLSKERQEEEELLSEHMSRRKPRRARLHSKDQEDSSRPTGLNPWPMVGHMETNIRNIVLLEWKPLAFIPTRKEMA